MKTILTKKILSATAIFIGVQFITINSQAEIYKWTDKKGVTHYSSQKPIQQKIKTENIENQIRSAAGKYKASSQNSPQSGSKNTTTKSSDQKKKTKLAGPSAKLISYCKNQRKNLSLLKQNYRNKWQDKEGKSTWLDQKQRKEKVNTIQDSITKECAGV